MPLFSTEFEWGSLSDIRPWRLCLRAEEGAQDDGLDRILDACCLTLGLKALCPIGAQTPPTEILADAFLLLIQSGSLQATTIELIHNLKAKGVCVLCAIDRERTDDLATLCSVLLEGADHVLDLRSIDFISKLSRALTSARKNQLEKQAEVSALQELMNQMGFAGKSDSIQRLFRSLRVASTMSDLPVMVTGETGTGKELIASAIHALDLKGRQRPLITINCAALPEAVAESEFFGHQRGAFTGADRERRGLLRTADGGTLFLDEVGELSPGIQAKLLRVLQSGQIRSVGADREVAVNVRIIAATNRSLVQMVHDGTFREDLYHRLNVLSLHIPPLRERQEDIPPLVTHFISKHRQLWRSHAKPEAGEDFLQALRLSRLPGNARQVENLVCRALVNSEPAEQIGLKDLPSDIWRELSIDLSSCSSVVSRLKADALIPAQPTSMAIQFLQQHDWNFSRALHGFESMIVRETIGECGGNQSKAARRLGITARSIYNKLNRTGQL